MAITSISSLWTPDIWIQGMREKQAKFPSVFNSRAVLKSDVFDNIASGAGVSANVPFFKDITDQDDEIQVQSTGPSKNDATSGLQVAPILNRVTANGATALSGAVSGSDPVANIVSQLVARRLMQRNKTLIAILRGAFNGLGANAAAAPLLAVRTDAFDESGNDATSSQTMNPDLFINAKAGLGELANELSSGAMFVHPNVLAALEKADRSSFKNGLESGLPFTITTYRDVPIFTSESLVRAGTTNGFVYETYILAGGVVGYGEKAQAGDVADVASLQYDHDKDKNDEIIYDRTRFVLHLNGMKWVGSPAGQSATNTELRTAANWELVYNSASRVGAACIRTNA